MKEQLVIISGSAFAIAITQVYSLKLCDVWLIYGFCSSKMYRCCAMHRFDGCFHSVIAQIYLSNLETHFVSLKI